MVPTTFSENLITRAPISTKLHYVRQLDTPLIDIKYQFGSNIVANSKFRLNISLICVLYVVS